MRKTLFFLSIVAIIASCKKDNSGSSNNNNGQAPVVTSSAMADFKAGGSVNFFEVNLSQTPITVPAPGANQTWNFSNLAVQNQYTTTYNNVTSNAAFSTATYVRSVVDSFGTGATGVAVNSTYYYEVGTGGWAFLGRSIPQLTLNYPALGGSLNFPAQNVVLSVKNYEANFPLHYNDSSSVSNITETYNFTATAPALLLNNTPGTEVTTTSYKNNVIAWGTLQLKGYSTPLAVLVEKRTVTQVSNYTLGGQPAPAALLSLAGLANGQVYTYTYYNFFSPTIGYVGEVTLNSSGTAVVEASFRKNF